MPDSTKGTGLAPPEQDAPPRILLDEKQAARVIGFKPRTLSLWRARGNGPPFLKIGLRCVRYKLSDLRTWADAQRARRSTCDTGDDAGARDE